MIQKKKLKNLSNKIEELIINDYKYKIDNLNNNLKKLKLINCKNNKNIPNTILFL